MSASPPASRHRVVVVGGGLGGMPAIRLLARLPVDVTLIDRRNHHLFQPLLYQVATGMLSPGQIAPTIRHTVRNFRNVEFEMAAVTGFDLDRRVVITTNPVVGRVEEHPYDTLIVATGSTQSYFGHDELARYAPGMKTIDDALELRRRIFGAFEMAELAESPEELEHWLTMVVVGAGPTGVELAGQIRELAVRSLRGEYRTFDPATVRVLLLDAGKEPLATFGDRLSERATAALEQMGVELRMDTRVVNVDAFGVDTVSSDGTKARIGTHTTIWAAGVQASPLAAALGEASGAEVDRAGRVHVLPDLTLPSHPEVFVVGDMAATGLPGVAEVAIQGGLHAANTVRRRLRGEPAKQFRYRDVGSVAAIGRFKAIASLHRVRLSGFPAWVVWFFVHIAFLGGFGNRLTTILRWLRSMIGRGRAERQFSVAHTGGDLSLPEPVLEQVRPTPFPNRPVEPPAPKADGG